MGYGNIKIYNGGLKDWLKSGYPVEAIEPLSAYEGPFLTADELLARIKRADAVACRDPRGEPLLTLLDLRNERFLASGKAIPSIKTTCPTLTVLLDDLRDPEVRSTLPSHSPVVTVTETGNRDRLIMRFLRSHDYTNIMGLKFGMRGWIKHGYPIVAARNKP